MHTNFGSIDWVIVVGYLSLSIIIGIYANKHVRKLKDYIVAGRGLGLWLAIATFTGTEFGLVTVMYQAEAGYGRGFSQFFPMILMLAGPVVCGLTGFVVYRLRATGVMTVPEFYEKRYNKPVRFLGGIILAISGIINMGLFLKMGSRFVIVVLGFQEGSGALATVMCALLAIVLFYTCLGGMVSVVLTDFMQFLVLSVGAGIITWFCISEVSWAGMFEALQTKFIGTTTPDAGLNPFTNPEMGWAYALWAVIGAVLSFPLWMPVTQRALSTVNPKTAQRLLGWSIIPSIARAVLPITWGVAAFAFFAAQPDSMDALRAVAGENNPDTYATPAIIAHLLPTGILGFVVAGMLAAFMSTHDSYLLSWAAVITQDIVGPLAPHGLKDRTRIWLTRAGIIAIGIFVLLWGLWFEPPSRVFDYMFLTAQAYAAGAAACIIGGLYWKRASCTGAVLGLLGGLSSFAVLIDWKTVSNFKWVKTSHIGLGSIFLAFFLMVLGSLLFPDKKQRTVGKDGSIIMAEAEGGR